MYFYQCIFTMMMMMDDGFFNKMTSMDGCGRHIKGFPDIFFDFFG